jgi:hypothetical protein
VKRRFEGLHEISSGADDLPEGLFLVQVVRAQYRWHAQKPYYTLRLMILEPGLYAGRAIVGRLYCTAKALWKLNWFLRDFGYESDLLGHDEIDDKHLLGLRGVVKISHLVVNGRRFTNLDGFAPASQWADLSGSPSETSSPEVA